MKLLSTALRNLDAAVPSDDVNAVLSPIHTCNNVEATSVRENVRSNYKKTVKRHEFLILKKKRKKTLTT